MLDSLGKVMGGPRHRPRYHRAQAHRGGAQGERGERPAQTPSDRRAYGRSRKPRHPRHHGRGDGPGPHGGRLGPHRHGDGHPRLGGPGARGHGLAGHLHEIPPRLRRDRRRLHRERPLPRGEPEGRRVRRISMQERALGRRHAALYREPPRRQHLHGPVLLYGRRRRRGWPSPPRPSATASTRRPTWTRSGACPASTAPRSRASWTTSCGSRSSSRASTTATSGSRGSPPSSGARRRRRSSSTRSSSTGSRTASLSCRASSDSTWPSCAKKARSSSSRRPRTGSSASP